MVHNYLTKTVAYLTLVGIVVGSAPRMGETQVLWNPPPVVVVPPPLPPPLPIETTDTTTLIPLEQGVVLPADNYNPAYLFVPTSPPSTGIQGLQNIVNQHYHQKKELTSAQVLGMRLRGAKFVPRVHDPCYFLSPELKAILGEECLKTMNLLEILNTK